MTGTRAVLFALLLVLVGVLFGVCASMANHLPGFVVASKVLGVGWSWAALGIVVAVVALRYQTLAVIVVLLAAVAGYYCADLAAGTYSTIDFSDPRSAADPMSAPLVTMWFVALLDFALWSVCALIVSWPLARIGVAIRRTDAWGLAARLVIPVGAAVEMLALRLPSELAVQPDRTTVLIYSTVAATGIGVALVLVAMFARRAWAYSRSSSESSASDATSY